MKVSISGGRYTVLIFALLFSLVAHPAYATGDGLGFIVAPIYMLVFWAIAYGCFALVRFVHRYFRPNALFPAKLVMVLGVVCPLLFLAGFVQGRLAQIEHEILIAEYHGPEAIVRLGERWTYNRTGKRTYPPEAVLAFRKAAEHGSVKAQQVLGAIFARGETSHERLDWEEAYFWYSLAAKGGEEMSELRRDAARRMLTEAQRAAVESRIKYWQPTDLIHPDNTYRKLFLEILW